MDEILNILQRIINQEGPAYLSKNPYDVYDTLIKERTDPREARLILLTLLASISLKAPETDEKNLSAEIQNECFLQNEKADQLAHMYKELFSDQNQQRWKQKTNSGLRQFCSQKWSFEWADQQEWHYGSAYVECSSSVNADFSVKNQEIMKKSIESELKTNPFFAAEAICRLLKDELGDLLHDDMEEYVNSDDYYEPWMEDYDCEDVLQEFAKKHGLELIDYSCDGDTSDWMKDRW